MSARQGNEMADEEEQQPKQRGFLSTITKRALAPLVATAATAATGYALRKGSELWEQRLRPKVQEKGGGRALVRETLEKAAAKIGGPISETTSALGEKVGKGDTGQELPASAQAGPLDDAKREQDRQQRERRRQERRQALEQARPS